MRVALDTDRVSLIQGDSLEVLRSFASKSFDIACFDPPYSEHTHAKFGKERRNDGRVPRDALAFPPMTPALIAEVMSELVRVVKGWILVTCDFYHTHLWGQAAQAAGGAWVRTGQWVKTSPKPQMTGDRPAVGSEDILIAHASPDTLEGRRLWDWNGGGHTATWRGGRERAYELNEVSHPNQKPAWLMQALLGMFAPRPRMECADCAFSISVDDLPTMQNDLRAEAPGAEVLRETMQLQAHGSEPAEHQRLRDHVEGLQGSVHAGTSFGYANGVHLGAPLLDGAIPWSSASADGGRAPQERGQAGQSCGESRGLGQESPRQHSKRTKKTIQMPALRRFDGGYSAWACPCCQSEMKERGALILDPYFGSGSTAIAALATERIEGESAVDTACAKCSKKLLEQYHPPLPVDVRVVGVEGDPKYVELAIQRIRDAAPSLEAA